VGLEPTLCGFKNPQAAYPTSTFATLIKANYAGSGHFIAVPATQWAAIAAIGLGALVLSFVGIWAIRRGGSCAHSRPGSWRAPGDVRPPRRALGELSALLMFSDSLRAQAHESANKLHTVVTLVEMGRPDDQCADRRRRSPDRRGTPHVSSSAGRVFGIRGGGHHARDVTRIASEGHHERLPRRPRAVGSGVAYQWR
jgi:hypothetical protein